MLLPLPLLISRKNQNITAAALAPVIEALEDRRLLSATIAITNTDNLVGTNRLIFNKIQILDTKVPNVTHDKVTLTIAE